jgi:ABC-type transport system involved in multi-copper enzyme maturation permease subunit
MNATTTPSATTRTRPPTFAGIVRSELYKALRLRFLPIGAILAFIPPLLLLGYILVSNNLSENYALAGERYLVQAFEEVMGTIRAVSGVLFIVLSVYVFGQEYQHGTLRIVLARGVDRTQWLVAKLLALGMIAVGLLAIYLSIAFPLVFLAIFHSAIGARGIQQLPATFGGEMLKYIVTLLVSAAATILMAMAATIIGRSLAFGMGLAIIFFPTDTNVLFTVFRALYAGSGEKVWAQATAYLLGPTLNGMPQALIAGERFPSPVQTVGATPLVLYDASHAIIVTLAYMALFTAISVILTRQRDVTE